MFCLDAKTVHERIGLCSELYVSLFKDRVEKMKADYEKPSSSHGTQACLSTLMLRIMQLSI